MTVKRTWSNSRQNQDSNKTFQAWEVWGWSEKLLTLKVFPNLKDINHLKWYYREIGLYTCQIGTIQDVI